MAKEKFDRSKPHVNVGTIGHGSGRGTGAIATGGLKVEPRIVAEVVDAAGARGSGLVLRRKAGGWDGMMRDYCLAFLALTSAQTWRAASGEGSGPASTR